MSSKITHIPDQSVLLVHLEDGLDATIRYRQENDVWDVHSTHIPEVLRGKGYGSYMMKELLTFMEDNKLLIIPTCSYVDHFVKRHQQWQHLKYRGADA